MRYIIVLFLMFITNIIYAQQVQTVDGSYSGIAFKLPNEFVKNKTDFTSYDHYVRWMVSHAPQKSVDLKQASWSYACSYRWFQWNYQKVPHNQKATFAIDAKKKLALQYYFNISPKKMTVAKWYEIINATDIQLNKPSLLDKLNQVDPGPGVAQLPLLP